MHAAYVLAHACQKEKPGAQNAHVIYMGSHSVIDGTSNEVTSIMIYNVAIAWIQDNDILHWETSNII